MVKINNEIRQKIIDDYNNDVIITDIMKNHNISKASYYRTISEYKKSENKSLKSQSVKENDEIENENENDTTTDIKSVSDKASDKNATEYEEVEQEEADPDTEKPESDIEQKTEKSFFNKQEFIEQLHQKNDNESENNNVEEVVPKPVIKTSKKEMKQKNILGCLDNSTSVKFRNNNNSKCNILDTIKNVQNIEDDIEVIKRKRHLIIIIRQYVNNFSEELKNLYDNKKVFEKKIFNLSVPQLEVILENIRSELSLMRNKDQFKTIMEFGLRGAESVCVYSGYNITGLTDELLNDESFKLDL